MNFGITVVSITENFSRVLVKAARVDKDQIDLLLQIGTLKHRRFDNTSVRDFIFDQLFDAAPINILGVNKKYCGQNSPSKAQSNTLN